MTIRLSTWELQLIEQGRTCEHCGKPNDKSCARCNRTLCTAHAACNLETMTHVTGLACDPAAPRGIPELCLPCGHVPAAHWRGRCDACPDFICQRQDVTDQWGRVRIGRTTLPWEAS